jgi:vesicle coat complex subunit
MEGIMDDDKNVAVDTSWNMIDGDTGVDTLDKDADNALKKVGGEPITTDLGTNFEHTQPVSLDDSDDSVSEDLAFINKQIEEDEAEKKPVAITDTEELTVPEPFVKSEPSDGITFGNSSYENVNENEDPILDTSEITPKEEMSIEPTGSLAELEKKILDKKNELESSIKKSQEELDKLTEILSGIKELKQEEANLMEKASGIL